MFSIKLIEAHEALQILYRAAQNYEAHLKEQNLLFVYHDKKHQNYSHLEVLFQSNNFQHLTGVGTRTQYFATEFYELLLKKKLPATELTNLHEKTTLYKLSILPALSGFPHTSRLYGAASRNYGFRLHTDVCIGNKAVTLGFTLPQDSLFYVPNTLMKEDINRVVEKAHKIVFVGKKSRKDLNYEILYQQKEFLFSHFSPELKEKINTARLSDGSMGYSKGQMLTEKIKEAEPGSTHIGKIVLVTDTHVYQATEKGIILHKAQSLDARPKLGADLWIGYCKEKGYVRQAKDHEIQKHNHENQLGR